jgi:hypothetical protein
LALSPGPNPKPQCQPSSMGFKKKFHLTIFYFSG